MSLTTISIDKRSAIQAICSTLAVAMAIAELKQQLKSTN